LGWFQEGENGLNNDSPDIFCPLGTQACQRKQELTMKRIGTISALAALAITALTATASAAVCTPTEVYWYPNHGGEITFRCSQENSTVDHIITPVQFCEKEAFSPDLMKGYLSILQAALLSGKKVYTKSTTCSGDFVYHVGIIK
jgi:hypothetical protein